MQSRHLGPACWSSTAAACSKASSPSGDLLTKVAGRKLDWTSIRGERVHDRRSRVAAERRRHRLALNLMCIGGYRHVPLIDDGARRPPRHLGEGHRRVIVDLFPDEILNLPPDSAKKPARTTSAEAPTDQAGARRVKERLPVRTFAAGGSNENTKVCER